MSSPRHHDWPARLLALAAAILILSPGCDSGDEEPPKLDTSAYTIETKGGAQNLTDHINRLTARYVDVEPRDPGQARELLLAYTTAAIGTAQAILADKKADPALRAQAAGTILVAYNRRRQADPKALDALVKEANRIEAENPKTPIAALAAFERTKVIGERFQASPIPERSEKIKELADAAEHLGRMVPAAPIAPELLNKTALDAEAYKRPDVAESLYKTLIECFPEDERTPFAKGALERMKLVGQVIEDFSGPGRDDKSTDLKDFRGKVVLIDFWATFCVPCARETPMLEDYRKKMSPKGLVLLGVCLDPRSEEGAAFIKETKLPWPQIFNKIKSEKMESEMTLRFGIQRLPFKLVIDREGKLIAYGHYLEDVQPELDKLLGVEKDEKAAKAAGPAEKK